MAGDCYQNHHYTKSDRFGFRVEVSNEQIDPKEDYKSINKLLI